MKRKTTRLTRKAIQELRTEIRQNVRDCTSADHKPLFKDIAYLWAVEQMSGYLQKWSRYTDANKAQRELRKWLKNEPRRIERLLTAVLRKGK